MAGIKGIIGSVIGKSTVSTLTGISDIVDKFITTPDEKKAAIALLQEQIIKHNEAVMNAAISADAAQSEVNKIEASNSKIFVSGWRPFIGWLCGVGLGLQFIVTPMATWVAGLLGYTAPFPELDTSALITLLTGMLGMGAMRTYEKVRGVSLPLS